MQPQPENKSRPTYRRALFVAVSVTAGLFFLRFGYDFGVSDQGEFLSLLLNRLEPDLLANDWYVGLHRSLIHIRTGIVTILDLLATFMPVWLAVLCVHVVASLLCISGIFRLSWLHTYSAAASVLASMAILVFTPHWNLGGNELMNRMLIPGTLAWGLALWGLVRFYEERLVAAGLLLGVTALIQPLISLQISMLLVVVTIASHHAGNIRLTLLGIARLVIPFIVIASPVLIPLILAQLETPSSAEALYTLVAFRAPHHYLPDSFPVISYIEFGVLVVLGGIGMLFLPEIPNHRPREKATILLLSIAGFLVVGFVGTSIFPIAFVTKLQLFKLTVLAKAIVLIALLGGLRALLPLTVERLDRWIHAQATPYLCVSFLLAILVGTLLWAPLAERTLPVFERAAGPEGEMTEWVRQRTPVDAVFLIPPSLSGFRYRAQRAVFVDFKAFPFQDAAMIEWYRRLTMQAPVSYMLRGGVSAMFALDESFDTASQATVSNLVRSEDLTFILRRSPFDSIISVPTVVPRMELVFQNQDWWIYRVRSVDQVSP